MHLTREQLSEALSTDYAFRFVPVLGGSFESAYNNYYKRCERRDYEHLLQLYQAGPLKKDSTKQQSTNNKEYIIPQASADDCEDGVCKL